MLRDFGFHTSIIVGGPLAREDGRLSVFTWVCLPPLPTHPKSDASTATNRTAQLTSNSCSLSSWGNHTTLKSCKSSSNTSSCVAVRSLPLSFDCLPRLISLRSERRTSTFHPQITRDHASNISPDFQHTYCTGFQPSTGVAGCWSRSYSTKINPSSDADQTDGFCSRDSCPKELFEQDIQGQRDAGHHSTHPN